MPGILVASTNRISPPTAVQATPVAMPIWSFLRSWSLKTFGGPRSRSTDWAVITVGVFLPSATLRATLRQTEAISRSRLRTPASRV